MSNVRISDLPSGSPVTDTDLLPDVQNVGPSGITVKVTASQLKTYTSYAPTLVTPNLGIPSGGTLTNCIGLPLNTGISGFGTGVSAALGVNINSAGAILINGGALGTPSSGNLTNCSGLSISNVSGLGTGVATALTTSVGSVGSILVNGGTLGTPSAGVLTNVTGLPVSTGISGLGTNVATALAVNVGSAGAFVVNGGALGTPSSGTLTSCTGLPVSSGISGLGTGVATALAVNTGTAGAFVVNGGALGTPSSGTLTSCTGLPVSTGISGLGTGVATALAVNTGTAGAFVVNGDALGTPSSGTLTNCTGLPAAGGGTGQSTYVIGDLLYASASNALSRLADVATGNALISGGVGVAPSWGKIGLTTHVTGTLPIANGGTNLTSYTANRVLYASATDTLGTSANLVFDGTNLGIGTSSPGTPLNIVNNSSAGIQIKTSDASFSVLNIGVNTTTAVVGFNSTQSGGSTLPFSFLTAGTERMKIEAAGNVGVASAVATPAGGSTAARLLFGTTAAFGIYYGSGAPTVSAAQGSIYLRSDGSSTSTRLYVNTNGSTTWTNVTTAA